MEIRRHLPCAVMTVGAMIAVWGSFRPWLVSGSAERSSYELLGLVDRLGFSRAGPFEWAVTAWPLMPLLLVTATVVTWWGRRVLGGVTAMLGGLYAAAVAITVQRAPGDGLIRPSNGTTVTLIGATLLLLAAVAVLAVSPAAAAPRRTPARSVGAPAPTTPAPSPSRPR